MAPTVIHLVGYANPTSFSSTKQNYVSAISLDEIITPPKNVAGKQCIISAAYCNYESNKPLIGTARASLSAYFLWNMNSIWSQIYSSPQEAFLQPALGVRDLEFGQYVDLGPRIIRIPEGPFSVRFQCRGYNLDNPITRGFYKSDTNISYGKNGYTSITVSGTNNTLTLTPSGGSAITLTIPAPSTTSITSMQEAIKSVLPSEYGIRIDGNTTDTRLTLTRDTGPFTVGGTFATAAEFQATSSSLKADYVLMSVILNITPIE